MSEEAESDAPKRKKPAAGKAKGKRGKAKKRLSPVAMAVIAAVAFGAIGIGSWSFAEFGNRGPSAEELAAAARLTEADRWRREEEPHNLTLTTFAVPLLNGKRLPSVPVMIRLQVAGTNGLEALCRGIPRVREATLRVFSPQGIEIRDKNSGIELAPYESFLLKEINRILAGPHVRRVKATQLHPSVAGARSQETSAKCRAALEENRGPEARSKS
jgi:flagellar basal body-associated protein FliL